MFRMETMRKDRDKTIEKLQRVIEQCIEDRNLKQKDVLELCTKKGYVLKQSELSRILNRKTTLALYPAIALSDALEIDMSAVLYPNRWRKRKWDIASDAFITDASDQSIKSYLGTYHMLFHSTDAQEAKKLRGRFVLYFQMGEDGLPYCAALLSLDTGEYDDEGEQRFKRYEGQFFISKQGVSYCILVNNENGDLSLLTFRDRIFLSGKAQSRMGLAMTIAAGEVKHPVVHKLVIYRENFVLSSEQEDRLINLMKMSGTDKDIYISSENLIEEKASLKEKGLEDMVQAIEKHLPVRTYYILNREILKSLKRRINDVEMTRIIAELKGLDEFSYTIQISEEDDKELFEILRSGQLVDK